MYLRKIGLFFLAIFCQVSLSHAAIILNVGNFNLLPNTANQKIQLNVTSTTPGTDPQVTGFNLYAQIGDGAGAILEPDFTNISYNGVGSIWNAFPTAVNPTILDEMGNEAPGPFAASFVAFITSGQMVPANGLFVELTISTVGLSSGTFPLLLKDSDIGADSNFILTGGFAAPASITNGTLTIQAIPEPSYYAGAILASGLAFGLWKKRKQ